MSDADWQPDDLALCVESDWENLDPSDRDPRHGGLHIVKRVVERRGHAGLVFAEFRYAYLASCFRRIAPLTEPERCAAMCEMSQDRTSAGYRVIGRDIQRRKL